MFELAWQFKIPVSVLERQMSAQEATEWVEYLKERRVIEEKGPAATKTYDWREMQARFQKIKELQQQAGKRVLERK